MMEKKIIFSFITLILISIATADTCFDISSLSWRTQGTGLTLNGQTINIQGIAWFGLETGTFSPGGLQTTSVEALLDILAAQKFNALRLPFSVDMVLNARMPTQINYGLNPNLQGKSSLQVMDYIIAAAAARGILAIPEQHRFDSSSYIPDLWYSADGCIVNPSGQCISYTEQMTIDTWVTLVNRYQSSWNLWALDIKNEPHGRSTWGTGNLNTDWDKAFTRISNAIIAQTSFPGVFFIEGIENNLNAACSYEPGGNWWGGNISPAACFPIYLSQANRYVFAPHTFCASVYVQTYFNDPTYPANMAGIWDGNFGTIANSGRPVIIGEWGCKNNDTRNNKWTDTFTKYLKARQMQNHIFFSINPDSADTDSILLGDWKTINPTVINYINQINTNPTKFTKVGSQICIGTVTSTTGSSSTSTTGAASTTSSSTSTTGQASTTTSTSTTGSSSTSTTGAASTTSSSTSTTGSVSTSTTGSGSTTGSTSGTAPKVSIQSQQTSAWTENGANWSVYNVVMTNIGSTAINTLKLSVSPTAVKPVEAWSAFQPSPTDSNTWVAQSWALPIQPNANVQFGYKIQSASPITFTPSN